MPNALALSQSGFWSSVSRRITGMALLLVSGCVEYGPRRRAGRLAKRGLARAAVDRIWDQQPLLVRRRLPRAARLHEHGRPRARGLRAPAAARARRDQALVPRA